MLGVVFTEAEQAPRVLGLDLTLRAVLALQSVGCTRIGLIGAHADRLVERVRTDARVTVAVVAVEQWAAGPTLLVGAHAVIDARAARALASAPDELCVADETGLLAAFTHRAGSGSEPYTSAVAAAPAGVLLRARTPREIQRASRALLGALRKPQDGWVSRALNRRLSLALTRWLVWTPIRPNALSLAILGVGLAGGVCAAEGTRRGLAIGGVLFQLQSVLDGCDGELSRLQFRGSRLGEWLDTIGDDLTNYAFFAGAALGLSHAWAARLPLLVGALGVGAGVIASGIEYRYLLRIGSGDLLKYPLGFGADPAPAANPGLIARFLGAIRPAFKRDFFALLTMIAALCGQTTTFAMLVLFAAGALATLGAVLASEFRRGWRV